MTHEQSIIDAVGKLEACRTAIKPQSMAQIDAWYLLGSAIDHLCGQLEVTA